MASVIVSPEAETDLEGILRHVAEQAGATIAGRYVEGMLATIESLAVIPEASGRPVPKLGRGLRCHPIGKYNVYLRYDSVGDVLSAVRVLHGRRRITRKVFGLKRRP